MFGVVTQGGSFNLVQRALGGQWFLVALVSVVTDNPRISVFSLKILADGIGADLKVNPVISKDAKNTTISIRCVCVRLI